MTSKIDDIVMRTRNAYIEECSRQNISRNISAETELICEALERHRQDAGDRNHDRELLKSDHFLGMPTVAQMVIVARVLTDGYAKKDETIFVPELEGQAAPKQPKPSKRKAA